MDASTTGQDGCNDVVGRTCWEQDPTAGRESCDIPDSRAAAASCVDETVTTQTPLSGLFGWADVLIGPWRAVWQRLQRSTLVGVRGVSLDKVRLDKGQ